MVKEPVLIVTVVNLPQSGKFKLAKFQYGRIVEYLQFSDTLEGEYSIERDRLLLAAHLNSALCHLKLGNDVAARESADRALELDSKSEKALFRRGMVRHWFLASLCCTNAVLQDSSQSLRTDRGQNLLALASRRFGLGLKMA